MFKKIILLCLLVVMIVGSVFPRTMQAYQGAASSPGYVKSIEGLDADIFMRALKAHTIAVRNNELANPHLLTIIDYSKASYQKRLWVIRLRDGKVLHHTYVAHGAGSGQQQARYFSNVPGSKKSNIGVLKTGDIYTGKHGSSLNLHGLEKGFNSNAFGRRVVMHGSQYVNPERAKVKQIGRSHGCPAVSYKEVGPIMGDIKHGSMVFMYYPDKHWLSSSKYT